MIIHVDVDAYYEWEPAVGASPTDDEVAALKYKQATDGSWLRRIVADADTHTAINIPEVMLIEAEATAKFLGKPFNRGLFVAQLVQVDIMKHHAPQHGFTKITVEDDSQLEAALNALLVMPRTPSGAGSAGSGSATKRARPFQRRAGRNFGDGGVGAHSYFHTEIRGEDGRLKYSGPLRHNLTTDTASGYTNRRDWQAKAMGGGLGAFFGATATGFATSVTATSLTNTGAAFPTTNQGLAGMIVAAGPNNAGAGSTVFGVIVSNTGTVLTIDQWYNPATGAVGTTPNGTCAYQVLPGQMPAMFLAVTSDATAPAASDTTLTSEATTNGFARALAAWAHTAAATTYTLTKTFTATGSLTINKVANFGACNTTGGGVMPFESAEPSPPVLISGDQCTQTATVTIN